MLDHDDGVARIDQAVEYLHQDPDVVEVQTRGWLVQNVQLPAFAFSGLSQLAGDLEPLRLAARQRGRRLPQSEISESDLLQMPERGSKLRLMAKALDGLVHRPLKDIVDGMVLDSDIEHLTPEACPAGRHQQYT